jgi:hypothetical protein
MAIECSDLIYKAYVDFSLEYGDTSLDVNTNFLETVCFHVTDSGISKPMVSDIITPTSTAVKIFDAQEGFPSILLGELYRVANQFIINGGLRMFFLITNVDNILTIPDIPPEDPEVETDPLEVPDIRLYVKQHCNSLATVASLDASSDNGENFKETFKEFAVLYEKTQDKTVVNSDTNVCLYYNVDTNTGFSVDYLTFLSKIYSYSGNSFLTQRIIFRRQTISNHDNAITIVDENVQMKENYLSFLSCDSQGGFIGNFTVGTMNDTATFWTAQIRFDIHYYLAVRISERLIYNALSVNTRITNNCLLRIQLIITTILSGYVALQVINSSFSVTIPDQTAENAKAGLVSNIEIAFSPSNIITRIEGVISTDISTAILNA